MPSEFCFLDRHFDRLDLADVERACIEFALKFPKAEGMYTSLEYWAAIGKTMEEMKEGMAGQEIFLKMIEYLEDKIGLAAFESRRVPK